MAFSPSCSFNLSAVFQCALPADVITFLKPNLNLDLCEKVCVCVGGGGGHLCDIRTKMAKSADNEYSWCSAK